MIVHDVEQGSAEWHNLRCGIPTASSFDRILTPTGKRSTQSDAYRDWLLAERIIGHPLESVKTSWMQRGNDLEAEAVAAYEFDRDLEAPLVGFVTTDDGRIGVSPDRLVGTDGLLEIKAPSPQVHVRYMRDRSVDKAYYPQIQGQLLVTERQWTDILSYCPGMPTVVIRVERDEKYQTALAEALTEFCDDMDRCERELTERYGKFERKPAEDRFWVSDEDVDAILAARRQTA